MLMLFNGEINIPNKLFLLLLSLALGTCCFGQKEFDAIKPFKPEKYIAVEPMYSWSVDNEISVNIGFVHHQYLDEYPISSQGPFLGAGIRLVDNDNRLVSKVGYAHYYGFLGGRATLLHYTNFSNQQFAIRPEVGLSCMSWLNLLYGYNISLDSNDPLNLQGHTLTLSLSLTSYLLKNKSPNPTKRRSN